jgi:hypothetical protein
MRRIEKEETDFLSQSVARCRPVEVESRGYPVNQRAAPKLAAVRHRRLEKPEYKQTIAWLFRNPVHASETRQQEKLKA